MSESNELLKSHSIILGREDNTASTKRGGDIDYDKVKLMITKSEKRVSNSVSKEAFTHQEDLREKVEKCVTQITDFMRKYVSSSRTMNTQIKSVNSKIEFIEDKILFIKTERTGALERESVQKRSLTTKRTNLTSPNIYRTTSASEKTLKKSRSLSLGPRERKESSDRVMRMTPKRSVSNAELKKTKRSTDRKNEDKKEKKYNVTEHKQNFNSRLDILEKM